MLGPLAFDKNQNRAQRRNYGFHMFKRHKRNPIVLWFQRNNFVVHRPPRKVDGQLFLHFDGPVLHDRHFCVFTHIFDNVGPMVFGAPRRSCLSESSRFLPHEGETKSNLEEYIEQNKKYLGVLDAFSSFLSTAKMFSFSGRLERKTLETGKGFNAAKTKANSFSEIIKTINAFLAVCSVFSVAFIALLIRGVSPLTAGQLVSLIQIWGSICTPFFSISWFIGALMGTSGIRKGTKELLQSAKQKEHIRTLNKLEAKDVSFFYDEGGVRVLDCISFAIEQKGIYLIRGASGTGKSTLLLAYFEDAGPVFWQHLY